MQLWQRIQKRYNVKVEKHSKAVIYGETLKLGMVDYIQREKYGHQSMWNKVKIIDKRQH